MKKLIFIAMVVAGLGIFNACQKDELQSGQENDSGIEAISLENDYLVFKDFASADSVASALMSVNLTNQFAWEQAFGFTSAKTYRAQICEKMEIISDSATMFSYVEELAKDGYFNWKDSSVTYPFYNYSWDGILNPDGIVKIGEDLYYFGKTNQVIVLGGKNSTLTNYLNGKINENDTTLKVIGYITTKLAGYDFDASLKSVSKTSSNLRLTVKLYYKAIAYTGSTLVQKVYYQLYYHQQKSVLGVWVDKQTHFYYYPQYLQIGDDSSGLPDEWGEYVSTESQEWHLLNSNDLANYYDILWTSDDIEGTAEVDGVYPGPWIFMEYYIYSGQVGSESNNLPFIITVND